MIILFPPFLKYLLLILFLLHVLNQILVLVFLHPLDLLLIQLIGYAFVPFHVVIQIQNQWERNTLGNLNPLESVIVQGKPV